ERMPMHTLMYWYIHYTNFTRSQYRLLARSRWLAKWSIGYSLIRKKQCITDQLIDEVMSSCEESAAGAAMQQFQRSAITRHSCKPYYANQLGQLNIPIIFISGDHDKLVPLQIIKPITE